MSKRDLDFSDDINLLQDDLLQFDQSLQSSKSKPRASRKEAMVLHQVPQNQVEVATVESSLPRKPEERKEKHTKRETQDPKPVEWSLPTSGFNTRIPPELSDLIDDLVYQRRKDGNRKQTKQQLTIEAFSDLLRKHAMLK